MDNYRIISYNVQRSPTLSGLLLIIEQEKPDIVLLQELKMTSEQLQTYIQDKGFWGKSNIDVSDLDKPGTGIVWKSGVPIVDVSSLEPCRLMRACLGPVALFNVYAPSGNNQAQARRIFYSQVLFEALRGIENKPFIIGGDFNCVVSPLDTEGGDYNRKRSHELLALVRDLELQDAFRVAKPNTREYTWHKQDCAPTRLDRFYLHPDMVPGLGEVEHRPGLSDHKMAIMNLQVEAARTAARSKFKSAYWKLNAEVLEDPHFEKNFSSLWVKLCNKEGNYGDVATWWEELAKPEIRKSLQQLSAVRARVRRDTKAMLLVYLDAALKDQDWGLVAHCRGRLKDMMMRDNMGFVVRSREKENAECEMASLYHLNRETKKGKSNNMTKLKIDGSEVENKTQIEEEALQFFTKLFQGHHGKKGVDTGKMFVPDFTHLQEFLQDLGRLEDASRNKMETEVKLEEVEQVVKDSQCNKAPGLDGITYEFYKKTINLIGPTLRKIFWCQMEKEKLIESDTVGATRLASKLEDITQVPKINEMRPITLLNNDYKLMSGIMGNRMNPVMGQVIKSGQLCQVKEKNILNGAHNIMSTIQYICLKSKSAAILSLDLFKAYDRVNLQYLFKVMEKMNFGPRFIRWVAMLHKGAKTHLLMNFMTQAIDVTFSVRQGDPIAQLLFIIYMEPLLVRIGKAIQGVKFIGTTQKFDLYRGWDPTERTVLEEKDEDYVDDIEIVLENEEDMLIVDILMGKFEDMSGAVLNRSNKSKIMGLGGWESRTKWPLPWLKTEDKLEIFGVTMCSTYEQILQENWSKVNRKYEQCINAWKLRLLDTIQQRVQVVNTFAMSKLWNLAQVLPLPEEWAKRIDTTTRNYVWRGMLEKLPLEEISNPVEKGGLGLPSLRRKARALFLKQTMRLVQKTDSKEHLHVEFWLGDRLQLQGVGGHYSHYELDTGPVEVIPEHYMYMMKLVKQGIKDEVIPAGNYEDTTSKAFYQKNIECLPKPKICTKRPNMLWTEVWRRLSSDMLDPKGKHILFQVINDVMPTRERVNRIQQNFNQERRTVWSSDCLSCPGQLQDVEHFLTSCSRVQESWLWLRGVLERVTNIDDVSNFDMCHLNWPVEMRDKDIVWAMGVWTTLVFEEVYVKNKVITVEITRGVFKYKYLESKNQRMPDIDYIPQITIFDDNG